MKNFLFLILTLTISLQIYSQYPEISVENFSVKQGLPVTSLACILQDNIGFIWVGEKRLHKYDGYSFTTVSSLPECKVCPSDGFQGIYSMIQDELGILWIVKDAGIVLYDPEKERSILLKQFAWNDTAYKHLGNSLKILRDSNGNIWLSGVPGLIKVSYKNDIKRPVSKEMIFTRKLGTIYKIDTINLSVKNYSHQNIIVFIYEDSWGNIWIGSGEGIYFMRTGTDSFIRIDEDKDGATRLTSLVIGDILQENEDTFLICTRSGLNKITNVRKALMGGVVDKSLLKFSKIEELSGAPTQLLKYRNQSFLIGTEHDLLWMKKDVRRGKETAISLFQSFKNHSYNSNWIGPLTEDRTGEIWAGYGILGMLKFNLLQSQFISYEKVVNENINFSDINPIFEDKNSNLWIGAYGGGLYKIESNTFKVTLYNEGSGKNGIMCLSEIRPDIFWLGLANGVTEFNSKTGKFVDPFANTFFSKNLSKTVVWDMLKDGNLIYIATYSGIFIFDFNTRKLLQFPVNKNDFAKDRRNALLSLFKSTDGSIWTVSPGKIGLCKLKFDVLKESLEYLPFSSYSLSEHNIKGKPNLSLYQDSQGMFWVGNDNLQRIDIKTGEIKSYIINSKLDHSIIRSITEDDHSNLWLGTDGGLFRFNKQTEKIKSFTRDDGLPILAHGHHSVFKNKFGRMYFGGLEGIYSFHPDSLKTNDSIPPVVITDFRLFNKSVIVDSSKTAVLSKNISFVKMIELQHNQNDMSIVFAALDYNQPSKNQYLYKLEGYQKDWIESDAKSRTATYTNLDPGTYIFRVKGSNSDGVWNEKGASLIIIIHKPWWATIFAWIVYIIFFIAVIGGYVRIRLWRLKNEKERLENLVKARTFQLEEQNEEILTQKEELLSQHDILEQQNQQITELDQLRSRFFTNISHEFRTPLSLIQSPVEELLEDPRRNEKERRKLNMVQRNAQRLLNLVNQLLDISKIDGSKMKLELVEADVMKHLAAAAGSFSSLAETKSIHYHLHFAKEELKTWFDPDKIEKIAVNLLSNAFKFTPEGGEIIFTAGYKNSDDPQIPCYLEFSTMDTGTGIPAGSLVKIFDRFYQVETSVKKEGGGTGIGLSLARDMAQLMHGDIKVESELCQGSTFSVQIPLGKNHLNESEFILTKHMPESVAFAPELYENKEEPMPEEGEVNSTIGNPVILIVEDNRDIRSQLTDNLKMDYLIIEAIDGVAGLKKATELIPDIIITDLMMPRMDGMELCDQLKNDERTSHIPVIMLTAKITLEDKIHGLKTGADDYIPKPFQMAELKARVANLIEQRKKLRERFSREISLEPRDITITSLDERFLNRAIEIVEEHINDEKFELAEFREEMNMSRSTLFRKLHALTDQSPTEFIRTIRLKRAASLLKQNFGNVTQVSIEAGFNNLSYFNRSFKKLFGVAPMEYMKTK
jgi:signal transduction histidine kinase/DNA-binding response OmpR family regulator/ligand-binding sensor domain-containing protein